MPQIARHSSTALIKITHVLGGFASMLVWFFFINSLYMVLRSGHIEKFYFPEPPPFPSPQALILFFNACVWAPLAEELIFRKAPLMLVKKKPERIWGVIIISSAIFGMIHGSFGNVMMQGIMGVILSYVYLKTGYWGSVVLHALWLKVIVICSF